MSNRYFCPMLLFLILSVDFAHAQSVAPALVCDGVLGNSGEQGATLVRFGNLAQSAKGAIGGGKSAGMGVVYDRFGSLWDRAGAGTLNRYALDGRLLGQYKIPAGLDGHDQLTSAGDMLIMQVQGQLLTLPIDAPAGTEAKALKRESTCISFGTHNGCIASFSKGAVSLVNAATGEAAEVAQVKDVHFLELGPDGVLYVVVDGKVQKFVAGKPVGAGWPRGAPGERMQLIGGSFFGSAWHGTQRRFTSELEPDPGVVLGGASGSFIGHLDQNSELSNGRGMAKIRANLYAISGFSGTLHLMQWQEQKRQFEIVRRIGAVPFCKGLGLDKDGNVWWHFGAWKWSDSPDTPIAQGINNPEEVGQAVMLDNEHLVAPGFMWSKPAFYYGPLDHELKVDRIETVCAMPHGLSASAVYKNSGAWVLLAIDKSGAGQSFQIGEDGRYRKDLGPVVLKTASPLKEWTSLGMKDPSTLLGAADGQVIELTRIGQDWKETRRWSSWGGGDGEKFGVTIYLSCDSGRLWISDTARQRVIVFGLSDGKLQESFGTIDKPGDDLHSLNRPQVIATRGDRAVVHDGENQRLIKLRISTP